MLSENSKSVAQEFSDFLDGSGIRFRVTCCADPREKEIIFFRGSIKIMRIVVPTKTPFDEYQTLDLLDQLSVWHAIH